ncbi:MAG: GNAT family N-acetyltransferase [Gemmatimonadota bacterium]|nr:GNAT family N-acetyltransferase [Gemmatimonadota bacterium]
MTLSPPPCIDTPRFVLRAWSVDDAPLLRAALEASDAHLRAWTPWVVDGRVPGQSLETRLEQHAKAFVAGTEWVYGMFSPHGTEVLGGCGLYPRVGPGAIEIGYWLSVRHTGRGLATEAAAILTRVAFTAPEIESIEIRCDPRNVASARVPERLGYRVDAVVEAGQDSIPGSDAEITIWRLSRAQFEERRSIGSP